MGEDLEPALQPLEYVRREAKEQKNRGLLEVRDYGKGGSDEIFLRVWTGNAVRRVRMLLYMTFQTARGKDNRGLSKVRDGSFPRAPVGVLGIPGGPAASAHPQSGHRASEHA